MATINPMIELKTGCESDRIALRGVRLDATLAGMTMRATIEQTFINLESKAIEAVYTFPLPETASVCAFEVLTGDHVLTGQIEETDEAIRRYDDAIATGHGAYMLEQDRPDVFAARVGNLKPGQAAKVRVSYVAPLELVDRSLRVRFPTTIAPRYVSAAGSEDLVQTAVDADALNPPHVLAVPYGIELNVRVQLGPEVKAISSPSHLIRVERDSADPADWTVGFTGKLAEMDRDIVLNLELARQTAPQAQAASGPDNAHYLAVTLVPEFDEQSLGEHHASETVFLLDCSGSMAGQSILQATTALELCLRSLSMGDRFNVCRFGSQYELLSSEPLFYSDATLKQALKFVNRRADLGGTEIYEPLRKILAEKPTIGEVRNVILLTDGQVSNEPEVIELARNSRATNRFFTFGIGTAASGYLIRNLARVTGGAAEFISANERIEDKVLRTFSRIDSPAVTDVKIDWDGSDVQAPGEIPPVFDGDVLRVFARAKDRLPGTVTLNCTTSSGPQSWTMPFSASADTGRVIALAWAQTMIQSLEDTAGPTSSRRVKRESSSERRIVEISKQFGILSSRTAFVAVEHRSIEERTSGMPEMRRIPIKLAHGWGGMDHMFVAGAAAVPTGARILRKRSHAKGMRGFVASKIVAGVAEASEPLMLAAAPRAEESADPLLRLLALQSADGWFGNEYREILRSAGIEIGALQQTAEHVAGLAKPTDKSITNERISATLAVVAVLNRFFADRNSSWRRAAAKARRWIIRSAMLESRQIDHLLQAGGGSPA